MNKYCFLLLFAALFSFPLFSQTNIKNYPLKDFIAPEIEYRRMDLGTGFNSNGGNNFDDKTGNNQTSLNFYLYYYEYLNLKNVQRTEVSSFHTDYASGRRKKDSIKNTGYNLNTSLWYATQTRLYRKNNRFWGIHGNLNYTISTQRSKETSEERKKYLSQNFQITPYLSYGKGRIQPIESARQAMDILLSLQKYGRLAKTPGKTMIDSLARVANRIRYKRFFDSRFKRIYQLEELDKALQNMGLVDTADMVYFANLSDIWNYALSFKRGTGIRYEGGLIPRVFSRIYKAEDPNIPEEDKKQTMTYGAFGFFSFNRMRPISYAWQSDLMIDLTVGYDFSKTKNENNENNEVTKEDHSYFRSMLNASWQFGYFPNTRTFAGITPYAALTYKIEKDADKTFGMNTGFQISSYYYLSPRLRMSFNARIFYVKSFDQNIPTPFWNTVSYSSTNNNLMRSTNDNVPFPVNVDTYESNAINYYFRFSLSYALF